MPFDFMTRKQIAEPIGVAIVAKGDAWNGAACSVRLFSESGCDEGAYYPAQDVHVYGVEQVKTLRDFCDKVLKLVEETK